MHEDTKCTVVFYPAWDCQVLVFDDFVPVHASQPSDNVECLPCSIKHVMEKVNTIACQHVTDNLTLANRNDNTLNSDDSVRSVTALILNDSSY